ncbi:hypothetical protein C8R46DRAFT_1234872 [Mycena filopes]|nr:hypothetical protein C8R46DRAFT_1234872 [Mycena filopes]
MSVAQKLQGGNIESFPNEILTEILLHGASILPPNSPDMVPFPTIASWVCHLWRELALATPDLWTTIRINDNPASVRVANLYVARAHDRLLDLTITLPGGPPSSDYSRVPRFTRILLMLEPHWARWRTLALDVSQNDGSRLSFCLSEAYAANPAVFTHLTHLRLDGDVRNFPAPLFSGLRGYRLQNTRGLVFEVGESMELLDTLDINATNILEDSRSQVEFRRAVAVMPRLTTLVLREVPRQTLREAFELRTVRSLAVQFIRFPPESLEVLTAWVKLPKLEYLELKDTLSGSSQEEPTNAKVPSVVWKDPQFPSVHTLRLVGTNLTRRRLALLEIMCPNITTLELVNITGTDTLSTVYSYNAFGSIPSLHSELASATNREDNPHWPSLSTLRVDSATFGPWVESFTERRFLLRQDRGLTSLALAPGPERDGLPANLTALLFRHAITKSQGSSKELQQKE